MSPPPGKAELEQMADEIFELTKLGMISRHAPKKPGIIDLTEAEFLTLDFLCKENSLTVGELQKRIRVLPAQMSRVIRSLESKSDKPLIKCRINPQDKMINGERMEKWVVRKAFESYLPESVAWRQKEQFSDGVGYSWIDTLKEMVAAEVSDEQLANAKFRFPIQTPTTKEEFYYRSIFESHFPSDAAALCVPQEASVACSTQIALEWDEAFKNMNDPSGRAVAKVHADAYVK